MKLWMLLLMVCYLVISCKQIRTVIQPTAREKYQQQFNTSDTAYTQWQKSYDAAKAGPLIITLPLTLSAKATSNNFSALGYKLHLPHGQQLVAEFENADTSRLFIELWKMDTLTNNKLITELKQEQPRLEFAAVQQDSLLIVIQPGINDTAIYRLRLYQQPAYLFPVAGKGNEAMQSFWGANRDGGARSHQGIDIFAARGTPVLAVSNGSVSFSGERGLGGKQVWLREKLLNQSVYYAHLDSFIVTTGASVQKGDTLGFVGNTGNAATTAPHLHFGIYTPAGAIDPLLFIKKLPVPIFQKNKLPVEAIARRAANIYSGPGKNYTHIQQIKKDEKVKILAQTAGWLHIAAAGGLQGFVEKNNLKEIK